MKGTILIVDDAADIRDLLSTILRSDYEVNEAESGAALKEAFAQNQPDVVLLDIKLPDADGLDLLPQIKKQWPETEVIVLTGNATFEAAVEATKRGAYHFLNKPFDTNTLLVTVQRALDHKQQNEENSSLRRALSTMSGGSSPVFQSAAMQAVVRTVERVAPSDVSILITGESGTGKEVIADLIHALSPRSKGKIIKINCAALPRELIESELFGSVKGAFTGAHSDREGLFRQAEGGTLFLGEISEMPIDTQSKLLRVLQDQEVRPVGGKVSYKTNCRIVAATNRKTDEAIKDGKLREDLFYRISAISVHLPPLRERREDIMPLANAFLKRFVAQSNRPIRGFTRAAIDRLSSFDWPGNVRQLQNEIQRAVLLCETSEIDAADLSITNVKNESDQAMDTNFTLLEGV
ncbi:MAG TPA: sigma-54 dependent transcriptional regulator, partial [Verrucomicrobiota bacterium]|nr:sigma-54 dependent transcriptional regulator [Verrucomicrobiota bacterium]